MKRVITVLLNGWVWAVVFFGLWMFSLLSAEKSEGQHKDKVITDQQKVIAGQQQDEKDVATNIGLRREADDRQQISIGEYQDGKKSDTIRTKALLDRVLNHFDRMQQPAGTEKAEVTDPSHADTCRTERDKAGELSRQLRSTLEKYGREAQRADENTRLLNLCITDLKAKEKLLSSYQ
ncbi:hypothetical protein [Morganella morganii]|uniref:hypothetical protein n=1 Tax=Morganella morganii TaxID=582 RepID=UPI0023679183|nr:hypothetical protein [Morganella morganii]